MPNWCLTRITINCEDEEKLNKFHQLLNEWTSKNYIKTNYGLNWLGNIVGNSGIGTVSTGKETDLRCRGTINWSELNDNQLSINTETAWNPMLKMWVKLLEKFLPEAELIYSAEECGCGLYCTNDSYMQDKYIIDNSGIENLESDWEAGEEKVKEVLKVLLKTEETNTDELINLLHSSEYNSDISIHKWEYHDVNEWE